MAKGMILETVAGEMKHRRRLLQRFHQLQNELRAVRAEMLALPYTGKFGVKANLKVCPGCLQPFGAREMRVHIPRCKGEK
jgi:hypothetical protein